MAASPPSSSSSSSLSHFITDTVAISQTTTGLRPEDFPQPLACNPSSDQPTATPRGEARPSSILSLSPTALSMISTTIAVSQPSQLRPPSTAFISAAPINTADPSSSPPPLLRSERSPLPSTISPTTIANKSVRSSSSCSVADRSASLLARPMDATSVPPLVFSDHAQTVPPTSVLLRACLAHGHLPRAITSTTAYLPFLLPPLLRPPQPNLSHHRFEPLYDRYRCSVFI